MTASRDGRKGSVVTPGSRAMVAAMVAMAAMSVLVLLLVFPGDAEAFQFGVNLRGTVSDADGNPLVGVKVTIRMLEQDPSRPIDPIELLTDETGEYFRRNIPVGFTSIVFEFEGYELLQEQREWRRAGPQRLDVTLNKVLPSEEYVRAQVANSAYSAGADAYNAGDYAEAVNQMTLALESLDDTPENAEGRGYVFALLGAAYLRQGQHAEAIEAYRTRLGYQPESAAAHFELAQALATGGDQEAASQYYASALALSPDDALTLYNVGATMVNAGDLLGGIARIERALLLQPVYPMAWKNIGYAYAGTEQYQKAVDAFEKYLEQEPEAADAAQIRDFVVALKEMIG